MSELNQSTPHNSAPDGYEYDALHDPNVDTTSFDVENARVEKPVMSSEQEAAIDAALRVVVTKPPLSGSEIQELERTRGKMLTTGDISAINGARAKGIDTTVVN